MCFIINKKCPAERQPKNPSGFTLVEVLVAFLIVATTMQIALLIFGGQTRQLQTSHNITEATRVADSALAQLEASGLTNAELKERHELNGLWWSADIRSQDQQSVVTPTPTGLLDITMEVFASEDSTQPLLRLETKRINLPAQRG